MFYGLKPSNDGSNYSRSFFQTAIQIAIYRFSFFYARWPFVQLGKVNNVTRKLVFSQNEYSKLKHNMLRVIHVHKPVKYENIREKLLTMDSVKEHKCSEIQPP
eukprot:2113002-Amphidinium_carterae.1